MTQFRLKTLFVGVLFFSSIMYLKASTYYVSPAASASASGTITNPITFSTALSKALVAGDTIFLRGGLYSFSGMQTFSKSGNSTRFIHLLAYQNEVPIFDFRTQFYSSSNIGFKISGSYLHIKGLTIQGAGDNGMQVTGSNNIIEFCTFRWNCDSGLQMKTGSSNLILNCDSYENFDYQTGGTSSPDYGGNADGFADKQYTNTGTNTYKGCRSWLNSDDAWDSFEKIGNTVYDSCWSYANGPTSYDMTNHIRFKTDSAAWFSKFKNASGKYVVPNYGNGNGFKLGGNYTANNTTLRNCVAVANSVKGFDQNNNNGVMTLYNCTSFANQYNYGFSNSSYGSLILRNCISLNSLKSNSFNSKSVSQSYNSWNSGFSCAVSDFVNLEMIQMINERQSNGSLPEIALLHQSSTSAMINKGLNVGIPYAGVAPDLGAFEYRLSTALFNIKSDMDVRIYIEKDMLIVIGGDIQQLKVYNVNGKQMLSASNFKAKVSTISWPRGVYLASIKINNKQYSTKFTVQ